MTERETSSRLYGEKEIGQLLKRATELQHDEPPVGPTSGMSLAELEEIAREAGIDPRHLRRAAFELDTGGMHEGGFWAKVVGDDLMLVREIAIPGEMPDSGFERVVGVIQRASREHGQPSLLGRTLTWRAETPNKTRTVQITVSVRDGETVVRSEENLHQFAGGLFGGTVSGVGVGAGLGLGIPLSATLGSLALGVAFPVGLTVLSYIGCRAIYKHTAQKRRNEMANLFEQIHAEVRTLVANRSIEGSDSDPPRLTSG